MQETHPLSPRARLQALPQATPLLELLLTLLALGLLAWVALPLADASALVGLGRRYAQDVDSTAKAGAAMALARHLPQTLAGLALGGWLALRLARSSGYRPGVLLLQAAIGSGVWAWVGAATPAARQATLCAAAACAALGLALLWLGRRHLVQARAPLHAWVYPGWVLFSGLGLIWLVDYSARAYPAWRFLALHHAHHLFWAYALLLAVAAVAPQGLGLAARLCALLDHAFVPRSRARAWQRGLPALLPVLYGVWAATVVLVFGSQRPSLTSELLRLPLYLLAAWMLYRWAAQGQTRRALGGLLAVVCLAAAGLVATHDFGPLLLIGLGLALGCGLAVSLMLGGQRVAVLAGVLVALVAALLMAQAVNHADAISATLADHLAAWGFEGLAHKLRTLLAHIASRAQALGTPFSGRVDYLSELRWFAAATPPAGHGLTHVPWCGTVGALSDGLAHCAGVPREMHSDYVFAGLAGLWGSGRAVLITLALALWLLGLAGQAPARAADPQSLGHWLRVCFVTVTLVQLFYTALGSLGLVVLTGVTYPLLGYGATSLLMLAGFVGLALHR